MYVQSRAWTLFKGEVARRIMKVHLVSLKKYNIAIQKSFIDLLLINHELLYLRFMRIFKKIDVFWFKNKIGKRAVFNLG